MIGEDREMDRWLAGLRDGGRRRPLRFVGLLLSLVLLMYAA